MGTACISLEWEICAYDKHYFFVQFSYLPLKHAKIFGRGKGANVKGMEMSFKNEITTDFAGVFILLFSLIVFLQKCS